MASPPVRHALLPFPQRGATIANLIARPSLQPRHVPFSCPISRADATANCAPSYYQPFSTSPLTTRAVPTTIGRNLTITSPFKAAIGLRVRASVARQFSNPPINKGSQSSSSSRIDTGKSATLAAAWSGNAKNSDATVVAEGAVDANRQPESHAAVEKHTPSPSLEKGTKGGRLNLRARLSKEKDEARKWSTLKEIWRLLRIARRETWPLMGAVALLLVSSAVTISVPLTIGKVMSKWIYKTGLRPGESFRAPN